MARVVVQKAEPTLGDFVGGNWPQRFHATALTCGYDWAPAHIASAVSNMVKRHGLDPVELAWNWWAKNAARMQEKPSHIHPQAFAKMVGYWIHMSKPAA